MVPTPHMEAKLGQIAPFVLMPGDPLRAKFVAETFLKDPVCYNTVRGMLGYTGTWNGVPVSVQGSGMGIPSIGIYSYELYHFYNVQTIIRIGSAGSLQDDLKIGDIAIGMGACTNSNFAANFELPGTYAPIADFGLVRAAAEEAERLGLNYRVGNVVSNDNFYGGPADGLRKWRDMGALAVEMEAAGLYMTAAAAGKKALAILTISDCPFTGEATTSQQRQTSFTDMMKVALSLAEKQ